MSTTSQATAEASQNYIFNQLEKSTDELVNVLTITVRDTALTAAVNLAVVMLLLFIIALIVMVVIGIITYYKAIVIFLIGFIIVIVLASIFVTFIGYYTRKQLFAVSKIFSNYASSQEALELINNTAGVYLNALEPI